MTPRMRDDGRRIGCRTSRRANRRAGRRIRFRMHDDAWPAGGRSRDKLAPIAVRIVAAGGPALPKPPWRRERRMTRETVAARAAVPRTHRLHSVREAAMRPNLGECFASAPRRS
ncbi:lipoic acid synthetase [Burkholderia thailandensis]|uniref:lipoic acid synthetase n=2 Tax=Burkholderia thailandensis TaxID=57975 RepID=UPI0004BA8BCA|nr:lipoic acid synthetase [Burkholderia thailandensis]